MKISKLVHENRLHKIGSQSIDDIIDGVFFFFKFSRFSHKDNSKNRAFEKLNSSPTASFLRLLKCCLLRSELSSRPSCSACISNFGLARPGKNKLATRISKHHFMSPKPIEWDVKSSRSQLMSFMGFIYKYDLCVCVCERESGVLWDCVHVSKTGIPKQSAFFFFKVSSYCF